MKVTQASVSCILFSFELPDFVSEEPEFLINRFFAHGAAHGSGVWANQRKRHGRGNDIGRGGGGWTGAGGEFVIRGRGHERSGLFVKVGGIVLIITGIM